MALKRIEIQQKSLHEKNDQIHQEQAVLLAAVTRIRATNPTNSQIGGDMPDDFAKKYELGSLPFKSLEDFLDFDMRIQNDEDMLESFVSKKENSKNMKGYNVEK